MIEFVARARGCGMWHGEIKYNIYFLFSLQNETN
jgi:hypothetical protein